MRNNYLGGTTTTGGTSTLTLTAAEGLALPAAALIADQMVEYSIIEFTDATKATIAKAESGWGIISSGNVLTRSKPTTTDSGGAFVQTATSALSFGSSNVFVYIAPIAEGGPTAYPARANFVGVYGYGPNEWVIGANLIDNNDYGSAGLSANTLYMVPVRLEAGCSITTLGVNVSTVASGKVLSIAIASADPTNGLPGTVLQTASALSMTSTGIISGSVTGRILAPGWYWSLFSTDGTPAIYGASNCAPNPMGSLGSTARTMRYATRGRTHANFTAGTSALSGSSGSPVGVTNAAAPIFMMR